MSTSDDTIERSAVGRMANLGDLYDCRSDKFCAVSLFGRQLPVDVINTVDCPSTDTFLVFKETFEEKFNKINVTAELKVSLLAGLIKVSQSIN